jgi:DNA-binding NarL/FixJ family response regulator
MPDTIRIGLLDTDEDVRFGRKLIFSSLPKTEVVFDSDGASSDLDSIQDSLIDVLVIDQKLASGAGIDFYSSLRRLTGAKQAPPAIVTASYAQPALLLEALEAGVFDVVAIEQGAKALVDSISKQYKQSFGKEMPSSVGVRKQDGEYEYQKYPENEPYKDLKEAVYSQLARAKSLGQIYMVMKMPFFKKLLKDTKFDTVSYVDFGGYYSPEGRPAYAVVSPSQFKSYYGNKPVDRKSPNMFDAGPA